MLQLGILLEAHDGFRLGDVVDAALLAEREGFHSVRLSDHLLRGGDYSEVPYASRVSSRVDTMLTLAVLAERTRRIRIGSMMTPAYLHNSAQLALAAYHVQVASAGRLDLGMGAGSSQADQWVSRGVDLSLPQRFDILDATLSEMFAYWNSRTDMDSSSGPGLPRVVMGGLGRRRTPSLVARYASEYNAEAVGPERFGYHRELVRVASRECGRKEDSLRFSTVLNIVRRSGDWFFGVDEEISRRTLVYGLEEALTAYDAVGVDLLFVRLGDPSVIGALGELASRLSSWLHGHESSTCAPDAVAEDFR